MKPNKLIILISIALIATLILVILVREDQHNEAIIEYLDREIQKEQGRLETYREFTKNYNELYSEYNELYLKYGELARDFGYYNDSWKDFICTGYSANDSAQGTNNICATTFNLDYIRVKNLKICAVDPEVIPLYSIVEIKDMGAFVALDTGGAIKGNRIDILFSSKEEALDFGIQEREIRIIK